MRAPSREDRCPKCGAPEVEYNGPRTVYACGSSDYDQRPGSFKRSTACPSDLPEMTITRKICRLNLFRGFLSSFRWFRKMYGGRWELWMVDFPVCSDVWCDVPAGAPESYREGLWRGNALAREDWA